MNVIHVKVEWNTERHSERMHLQLSLRVDPALLANSCLQALALCKCPG